jgi:signal transduction histidine kinase
VRDDGHGFDAQAASSSPTDTGGLASMRHWADALNGDLTVESGPQGTVVRLQAPSR